MKKNPYISKQYVIWHFGIVFSNDPKFDLFMVEYPDAIIFEGLLSDMPDDVANRVAELHPRFNEYYERAMAPLFKGYKRPFNTGTESPQLAIRSRMSAKDEFNDCQWVLIWRIMETEIELSHEKRS